jgi:hypothetical protein
MRRTRILLGVLSAALLLAACGRSPAPTPAPSLSAQDPSEATILFVGQTAPAAGTRSGPPSGDGSRMVRVDGRPTFLEAASPDGSTLLLSTSLPAAGTAGSTVWVVRHGLAQAVSDPGLALAHAWALSADTSSALAVVDRSVVRYELDSGTSSTWCGGCVPDWGGAGSVQSLSVSPDLRLAAVSQATRWNPAAPVLTHLTVLERSTGRVLWESEGKEAAAVQGWTFADDDTLVATVGAGLDGTPPAIHRITGLRTAHVADVDTGVTGYGPVDRADGVWWYYHEGDAGSGVVSVFVNPDLTPGAERRLVDRADGETSYGYTPVSSAPGTITVAGSTPSS